jgi:hypothetical protein
MKRARETRTRERRARARERERERERERGGERERAIKCGHVPGFSARHRANGQGNRCPSTPPPPPTGQQARPGFVLPWQCSGPCAPQHGAASTGRRMRGGGCARNGAARVERASGGRVVCNEGALARRLPRALRLRHTFESGQMAAARATSRGANRPFSSRSLPVSSCSSASVELLLSCPSFAPRFFPPKKREPVIEVVARATGRGADSSVGPGAPRQRPARHETRRRPGADPAPCAQAVRLGGVERHHLAQHHRWRRNSAPTPGSAPPKRRLQMPPNSVPGCQLG